MKGSTIIASFTDKWGAEAGYRQVLSVAVPLILSTGLFLAAPAYLVIVVFKGSLMTSWYIATIYVIALGSAFYMRFLGGKWKDMRVIEKPVPAFPPAAGEPSPGKGESKGRR